MTQMNEHFFDARDAITSFLFLNDPPSPVDFCFVLGCPTPTNMDPAIDLYTSGFAKIIVISGHGPRPQETPECELFMRYAIEKGVQPGAFVLEARSTNTLENFAFSRPIIEERFGWSNIHRVAVVSKPYHMRRAIMTARRQWPEHVHLLARPSNAPDDPPAATWWQTPSGRHFVLSELKAIGTYGLKGDVGGF